MNSDFLQQRIAATQALIVAYEDAVTALGEGGGIQSYTLDTSQSRQTVTRADLPALNKMIESLYNRCAVLEARLTGGHTVQGRPCW